MVMGTAGYMSPEQVRGRPVDHRADIFAFGAILYEMLAGKRAFQRSTSAETMAAILNEDPPGISQIVQSTPPGLQRVVHRCLEKNPEQRFQSASDLAFALEALSESGISSGAAMPAPGRRWPRKAIEWATGAMVILVAAAAVLYSHRKSRSDHSPLTLTHSQITFLGDAYEPAISPDGKSVVYVIRPPGEDMKLMVQDLSGGPSLELMHSTNLEHPSWAPDGSMLLFTATTEQQATGGTFCCIAPGRSRSTSRLGILLVLATRRNADYCLGSERRMRASAWWTLPPEHTRLYPHPPINGCTA